MDENNLDPEQIRQLNEAFQELQETVRSTTETVKTKDLQKSVDNTKKSVDKLASEFDKLTQLIKNSSSAVQNPTKPSETQSDVNQTNLNTSIFDNVLKSMAGSFSGLNNVTLNLIKSFSSLSDLLKDKTTTTKISERHKERTRQIIEAVDPLKPTSRIPIAESLTEAQPTSKITPEPVVAPSQPDLSSPVTPQSPLNLESITAQNVTIEGLQKLAQSLNEADKSILRNTGYIKDGNGNWKKYSSLMDIAIQKQEAVISPVDKQVAAIEDTVRSYGYVQNENGKWVSSIAELTDVQKKELAEKKEVLEQLIKEGKARKEQEDREKQRKKSEEDLIKNFKELSRVAGNDLAKNFFNSSQGMGKYGDTLNKFGGGIIDVTKNLGPLGKAIGFVAGGLFKLVGSVFKQNEALNKAYEELSELGAVDFRGISQMFSNLQNAGFTVNEIGKFTGILKAAGTNLAGLGVTAADGAKKVSDTFKEIKNTEVEEQLRMLGYNSETLFKTFTDYQGMISRLGRTQNLSVRELAERSSKYAKNLDELAKLTGESRDNLQRQQEAIQSDITFRTVLAQLADDEQERVKKLVTLMEQYGEETGKGVRNLLANAGPTIDEATNLYLQTGAQVQILINRFKQGTISAEEFSYEFAKAVKENSKELGVDTENRKKLSQIQNNAFGADEEVTRQMMGNAKLMDQVNKQLSKTPEQMAAVATQTEQQAKRENDVQRALENARAMTERNFEQARDRLIQLVGTQVTGAFEKLYTGLNKFGKALADTVYWITDMLPGVDTVDFRDLFRGADDVKHELSNTAKELAETNAKIEKANKTKLELDQIAIKIQEKNNEKAELDQRYKNAKTRDEKIEIDNKRRSVETEIAGLTSQQKNLQSKKKSEFGERGIDIQISELEKKRAELVAKQATLQQEYESKKTTTTETESPEYKKLQAESRKLQDELTNTQDITKKLNDEKSLEFSLLKKEFLKDRTWTEEDLKDKQKNKEFLDALAFKKQELEKKSNELLEKLNESNEKLVSIRNAELAKASTQRGLPAGVAPSTAGAGRGSVGMPKAVAGEGVDVAMGKKSNMTDYLKKVAQVESSGSAIAKAPTSSASGLFQFTKGTWEEMTKAMGKNYSLQDRFDPVKSAEVAAFMTRQRKSQIEEATGREASDVDLYLTHFLGAGGASKFLKAMDNNPNASAATVASPEQITSNPNVFKDNYGRIKTLQEIYNDFSSKLQTAETVIAQGKGGKDISAIDAAKIEQGKFGGIFSGPESGYPVLLHGKEIVIPMPDLADLKTQLSEVKKTELPSMTPASVASTTPINNQSLNELVSMQGSMIEILSEKLDAMIDKLSTSNDIQDRILTYQQT